MMPRPDRAKAVEIISAPTTAPATGSCCAPSRAFKAKDVWAMRTRMECERRTRELALFSLGNDSKLRACELVALKERNIQHGAQIAPRAI